MGKALAAAAAAFIGVVGLAATASAQVRDATYRGTLVCDKIPFVVSGERAAIEVAITGSFAKYTHPVIMLRKAVTGTESGTGTVDDGKIVLKGSWKGDKNDYEATYSGSFVRRSAMLSGIQTWTHEGKTYTRKCTGTIKRPLAVFLPR
jgi:hypothetical protein